jgi:RHS repeat-associated protein
MSAIRQKLAVENAEQPFGFAGGLYDRDTKLVHFGAREYDAQVGRFTSKDPIGFSGDDVNLYRYVWNNVFYFVDPAGTEPSPTG